MRTVTAQIPDEMAQLLDEVAEKQGRTRSWLLREAMANYLARQKEVEEATREGLDAIRAGHVVSHEEILHDLDEWGS